MRGVGLHLDDGRPGPSEYREQQLSLPDDQRSDLVLTLKRLAGLRMRCIPDDLEVGRGFCASAGNGSQR